MNFTYKRLLPFLYIIIFFLLTGGNVYSQRKLIKVISPNGNETLQINTRQGILWTSKNITKVDVFYSTDNGLSWYKIADNIDAHIGNIGWNVPDLLGKNAVVKITEHNNGNIFDVSDAPFTFSKTLSLKGNLRKLKKQKTSTVIMPLGNSITYDNRVNDNRPAAERGGYRKHLYELLNNAGIDFTFTGSEHAGSNYLPNGYDSNAGFPGIRDSQLTNLLRTGWRRQPQHGIEEQITNGPYLNTYPADIILLHIGTNDNDKPDGTLAIDVEHILDHIDSMNTETVVVLARIIDRVPNQNYVTQFNDNVEAMALDRVNNPNNDAYPDKIVMVDMQNGAGIDYTIDSMGTVGDGIPGDMNDQYHPNDKGYYKMAEVWFAALSSILVTPPVITMQPEPYSTVEGKPALFKVKASGTKPFTYRWKKNGTTIPGATDSVYQINAALAEDNNAHISCVVSNSAGNATSNEAILYVAGENERVKSNIQVLYDFEDTGNIITDVSNVNNAIDLTISNPTNTRKVPYGLEVVTPTIVAASTTLTKIYDSCTSANEITVEAWVKPKNITQSGPARIVTFSKNGTERNFTLGQTQDKYIFRLKTSTTNDNGEPALYSTAGSLTANLTHVVYTKNKNGVATFYINGNKNNVKTDLTGNFSNWDNTFSFGLANEFTTDRNWLGKYYLVALYNRALSKDEVEHNYNVGFNGIDRLLFPPSDLIGTVKNDTIVELKWKDNSMEELGYIVERKANSPDSIYYLLDTLSANATSYSDYKTKHSTSYFYRVKAFNNTTGSDYSDSVQVDNIVSSVTSGFIVNDFKLYQNYPNPFNPSTIITYSVAKTSNVSLVIYDALGREVARLIDNVKKLKGGYRVEFSVTAINKNLTSGIYFYRVTASPEDGTNSFTDTKKFILIK